MLLEADAHLIHYELAGVAEISRVQIRPIATPDGVLTPELLRKAVRHPSSIAPKPSAISLENTHSLAGGKVVPVAVSDGVGEVARELKLPLHLDGSRLWHASAFLNVPLERLAKPATTVMVTLSKGLGCPVGSVLAFPVAAKPDVWEIRKRLGGGMRQSGILAAAGLYALDHNVDRIGEDHATAKRLVNALAGHKGVRALPTETNIVMLDLLNERDTTDTVIPKLREQGVLCVAMGLKRLRACTHLDVSPADADKAAQVIGEVLA